MRCEPLDVTSLAPDRTRIGTARFGPKVKEGCLGKGI